MKELFISEFDFPEKKITMALTSSGWHKDKSRSTNLNADMKIHATRDQKAVFNDFKFPTRFDSSHGDQQTEKKLKLILKLFSNLQKRI